MKTDAELRDLATTPPHQRPDLQALQHALWQTLDRAQAAEARAEGLTAQLLDLHEDLNEANHRIDDAGERVKDLEAQLQVKEMHLRGWSRDYASQTKRAHEAEAKLGVLEADIRAQDRRITSDAELIKKMIMRDLWPPSPMPPSGGSFG